MLRLRLKKKLLLISQNKNSSILLEKIGIFPDIIEYFDVDCAIKENESPKNYNMRIIREKISFVKDRYQDHIIFAPYSSLVCSKKILMAPKDVGHAESILKCLSGRRHRVYSTICFAVPNGNVLFKTIVSIVKFKRLHKHDLDICLSTNEWYNSPGAYCADGFSGSFIEWFRGSHSGIFGLPLCQAYKLFDNYIEF